MALTKEDLQAIGDLISSQLEPIQNDILCIKKDVLEIKKDIIQIKQDVKELKRRVASIEQTIIRMALWLPMNDRDILT